MPPKPPTHPWTGKDKLRALSSLAMKNGQVAFGEILGRMGCQDWTRREKAFGFFFFFSFFFFFPFVFCGCILHTVHTGF